MESMNSFMSADSYRPPYSSTSQLQNPAETMLMNLGFGGAAEGFLPERFMRDWYSKISQVQSQYPVAPSKHPDSACTSPYGSASNLHNALEQRPPLRSRPSYEELRSASDLQRRIVQPFNRAATMSTTQSNDPPETPTSLLPPSLAKETRSDRLKEYIEAYAQNMSHAADARSLRIRQFASSRQKSLPSYLETLTEEDEVKSRSSWHKPHDGESRLQAFLREDSLSTASGKSESQCTSSGDASNEQSLIGSESDSLSGSDNRDYKSKVRERTAVSREQPLFANSPESQPVISRTLTLKMPNPAERRARLRANSKNKDSEGSSCTSEKDDDIMNSSKHTVNYNANADKGDTKSSLSKSPLHRSKSPVREYRPRSPTTIPKTPVHRPRSPRQYRKKYPNTTSQAGKLENAAGKGLLTSTDSASMNDQKGQRSVNVDTNRLFVAQTPMESPMRRRQSSLGNEISCVGSSSIKQNNTFRRDSCNFLSVILNSAGHGIPVDNTCNLQDKYSEDAMAAAESQDSSEVADIFNSSNSSCSYTLKENTHANTKRLPSIEGQAQIEPAMISIVLEDVDGNLMENGDIDGTQLNHHHHHLRQQQHFDETGLHEDLLHIPSCSPSSSSLSPIPLSPITVIEVSLDNQQDSMDTEEGTSSSKEPNDEEESTCDSDAVPFIAGYEKDSFHPTDIHDGMQHSSNRRHTCSPSSPSCLSVEGNCTKELCDACIEADDGNVSPILLFTSVSPETSSSSSPSVTGLASNLSDVGIQADDGRLSPLLLINQETMLRVFSQDESFDEMYFVSDQGVQCDDRELLFTEKTGPSPCTELSLEHLEMVHKHTQTGWLVRYEMSSQTDQVLFKQGISHACLGQSFTEKDGRDSLQHTHCLHQQPASNNASVALMESKERCQKEKAKNMNKNQSFDAEFWEQLTITSLSKLQKTDVDTASKSKIAQNDLFSDDCASPIGTRLQSRKSIVEPVSRPTSVPKYSAPSDSYEVVRCLDQESIVYPSSLLSHSGLWAQSCKRGPDAPADRPRSSVKHPTEVSEASNHTNTQTESKSISTNITIATAERQGNVSSFPKHRQAPPTQPTEKEHSTGGDQGQNTHVHISHLNIKVADYRGSRQRADLGSEELRAGAGRQADEDNTSVSKIPQGDDTCMKELCSPQETEPATPSGLRFKEEDHLTHTLHQLREAERFSSTHTERNTSIPVANDNECTDHDKSNSTADLPSPSPGDGKQPSGERQSGDGNVAQKSISVDSFSDNDFKSMEEAREFVLTRFLLRGSKNPLANHGEDPRRGKGDVGKQAAGNQNLTLLLNGESVNDGSFVQKAKVLGKEQPEADTYELSESYFHEHRVVTDKKSTDDVSENQHLGAGCRHKNAYTLERTSHTGTKAIQNLAFDCFLLRERSPIAPTIGSLNGKDSSCNGLETETSAPKIYSADERKANKRPQDMEKELNSTDEKVQPVEEQTRSDKDLRLLQTFAHSLLESACHDLQRNHKDNSKQPQQAPQSQIQSSRVYSGELRPPNNSPVQHEHTKSEAFARIQETHAEIQENERVEIEAEAFQDTFVSSIVSTSDDDANQGFQDSDDSSALTVVLVGSKFSGNDPPMCTENIYDTLCQVHTGGTPLVNTQPRVSLQPGYQSALVLDYKFRALSPKPFEAQVGSENGLSPARSQSADSLDSLRVNYSGSIDDILDVGEAEERPSFSHSSTRDFDDGVMESVDVTKTWEVTQVTASVENSSYTDLSNFDIPSVSQCRNKQKVSEHNLHIISADDESSSKKYYVSEDSQDLNLSSQLKSKPNEGKWNEECRLSASATRDLHEPFTDAKLTQLILAGETHPDYKRLKEQGFLDSFESSPSFNTPENELDSDADEQEACWGSLLKSPKRTENMVTKSDPDLLAEIVCAQNQCSGQVFGGYLSNISEEESNCDNNELPTTDKAAYEIQYMSGLDESTAEAYSNSQEFESCVEQTSGGNDFGIDVSIQPLPSNFQCGKIVTELHDKEKEPPEDKYDQHKQDSENIFTNDFECDDIDTALAHMPDFPADSSPSLALPLSRERNGMQGQVCWNNTDQTDVYDQCRQEFNGSGELRQDPPSPHFAIQRFPGDECQKNGSFEKTFSPACSHDSETAKKSPDIGASSSMSQESRKSQLRSELFLSLHPMQEGNNDHSRPRLLSAAEKREAYNKLTADRTGFGLSSSFSEENLSSPPLRPRRFQRSMSKESSCSDLSPKRVKRAVSRSSPTFNSGQGANSLQVPNVGESLVSKNTLSTQDQSSLESSNSLQPRSQSPAPGSRTQSRSNSPVPSRNCSPSNVMTFPDILLSPGNRSPTSPTVLLSRGPSPIPEVTISTVNQSLEVITFTSSSEGPSRGASPASDKDALSESQAVERRDSHGRNGNEFAHEPESQSASGGVPSKEDTNRNSRLPIMAKFHALQTYEPASSPEISPTLKMPSMARTLSSSGDESGPLHFPVSRTFYPSRYSLRPQPRARLWYAGDRNSSSTESPVPSTPSLSRDHSSTSDSSLSFNDGQHGFPGRGHTSAFESPRSAVVPPLNEANLGTISREVSNAETGYRDEGSESCKTNTESTATETQSVDTEGSPSDTVPSSADQQPFPSSNRDTATVKSCATSEPMAALYLRRSRFQKPENTISLQQKSSSSDQSSSEAGNSPRRRFFWATSQKTVVSAGGSSSKECSPKRFRGKGESGHCAPRGLGNQWRQDERSENSSSHQPNSWKERGGIIELRHSNNSSLSDQVSSDMSPVHSRLSDCSNYDRKQANRSRMWRNSDSSCDRSSPSAEQTSVSGFSRETTKRSVRDLARQFERKGMT